MIYEELGKDVSKMMSDLYGKLVDLTRIETDDKPPEVTMNSIIGLMALMKQARKLLEGDLSPIPLAWKSSKLDMPIEQSSKVERARDEKPKDKDPSLAFETVVGDCIHLAQRLFESLEADAPWDNQLNLIFRLDHYLGDTLHNNSTLSARRLIQRWLFSGRTNLEEITKLSQLLQRLEKAPKTI